MTVFITMVTQTKVFLEVEKVVHSVAQRTHSHLTDDGMLLEAESDHTSTTLGKA